MSNLLGLLRGISSSYVNNDARDSKKPYEEDNLNFDIWYAACQKTHDEQNKAPITIMLEDYSKMNMELAGKCSGINISEMEDYGFFEKLLGKDKENNIFRNSDLQKGVKSNYANGYTGNKTFFTQNDIYQQEMYVSGGLRYQRNVDDQIESALNFAKADIAAVEAAYGLVHDSNASGTLSPSEVNSYLKSFDPENDMYSFGLRGDYAGVNITPEEYASYIVAIDGLLDEADGLLSFEEIEKAQNMDFNQLQKMAQEIYDENFSTED